MTAARQYVGTEPRPISDAFARWAYQIHKPGGWTILRIAAASNRSSAEVSTAIDLGEESWKRTMRLMKEKAR